MDTRREEVRVDKLLKQFPAVRAIDHVSFSVAPGEIFGLVGPDGAGKTTTMRVLSGVLPADSGEVVIAGCDVMRDPESVKRFISYMPQRFGLYEDLTVDENLHFYADLFGVSRTEREQRAAELLRACGMGEFRARLAGRLSGGMKQKLALSCALIHRPRVLLLDEPTNGVDPVSRREFWAMLYDLVDSGVTVINSTAYLDEAERCHRIALMHRGRILMCDEPARLKSKMSGVVLSIVAPRPRAIREALAGEPGVNDVVLVGDAVHTFVDDAERRLPELRAAIESRGLEFLEIETVTPTIEDLFVEAVREPHEAQARS